MSISTPRDENRVPTLLATSNTDGKTVISVCAVDSAHELCMSDGTTGTSLPFVNSERDDNRVPALWAISSADGITPIPIYADSSTKKLLVKST